MGVTTGPIGAHVFWPRPRKPGTTFFTQLDMAIVAASAILWRALVGPIWLFSDTRGVDELRQLALLPLWDYVDTDCLESIPTDIHAPAFWDFGKTVCLTQLPAGACILDLDLIVWEELAATPPDAVAFLHWEAPISPWYLPQTELSTPEHYIFDRSIDWNAPVCNRAFLRCTNQGLRRTFLDAALEFAQGNRPAGSGIAEMLFAGQRLLAHTLRAVGAQASPVLDYLYIPLGRSHWLEGLDAAHPPRPSDPLALYACEGHVPFTHVWQQKHQLVRAPKEAARFCAFLSRRCYKRTGAAAERWLSVLNPYSD